MRRLLKAGIKRLATQRPTSGALGDRQAVVIAVAAQKGGVGKTTTSISLASAVARFHGKKVLLIDLDPQGHVATAIREQVLPGGGPLSAVLADESGTVDVREIAAPTKIPNLYVTPLDPQLRQTDDLLSTRIGKEFILREALREARTHFDVILIDCPPNLGNLAVNGLVAADQVLIPCDPSPLALKGVDALVDTISTIASRLNPDIDIMGVLLTRVDGRNRTLNDSVIGEIMNRFGDATVPVQVGINSSLGKAQAAGTDIFEYDANSRGARQYSELADWMVDHLG